MLCTLYNRHKIIVKRMKGKKLHANIFCPAHYCLALRIWRPQASRVQMSWPGICGLTCWPLPTLPITYPICSWHTPGTNRLVYSLSPANTSACPAPCLGSHQVLCLNSRTLVKRFIPRLNVPWSRLSLSSQMCVLSNLPGTQHSQVFLCTCL